MTDTNPVENFSMGAALVWTLCALAALAFGGFVAGRFSRSHHSGFVHGVLVWCSTLILTLLLLSAGTGMVLGGALKVLGKGADLGGQAMATGAGQLAADGLKRSADQLGSFLKEAVQSAPTNTAPGAITRAQREIGFALTKLFTPGNEAHMQDNRTAAIAALMQYSGRNEADATQAVDDWIASAKSLRTELESLKDAAETKAREAADRMARHLSGAALWAFFALLIGLVVAALSGRCGAVCAGRHLESGPCSADKSGPAITPPSQKFPE